MIYKAKDGDKVLIRAMGKSLRITAIADNDDDANRHMSNSDDAVVAVLGTIVFMANKYDKGI